MYHQSYCLELQNFAGSGGEKISGQTHAHFIYLFLRIDPVSSHSSLHRNRFRALENPIRRGIIYNSLCCNTLFNFSFSCDNVILFSSHFLVSELFSF